TARRHCATAQPTRRVARHGRCRYATARSREPPSHASLQQGPRTATRRRSPESGGRGEMLADPAELGQRNPELLLQHGEELPGLGRLVGRLPGVAGAVGQGPAYQATPETLTVTAG